MNFLNSRTIGAAVIAAALYVFSGATLFAQTNSPGVQPSDTQVTQQIHQAIGSDPAFSTMARNVQVVTANGKVTLHGVVANQDEKLAVGAKARQIAGPKNVGNQLEVATTH
jgi:osmotically-inducible protein OsmY